MISFAEIQTCNRNNQFSLKVIAVFTKYEVLSVYLTRICFDLMTPFVEENEIITLCIVPTGQRSSPGQVCGQSSLASGHGQQHPRHRQYLRIPTNKPETEDDDCPPRLYTLRRQDFGPQTAEPALLPQYSVNLPIFHS